MPLDLEISLSVVSHGQMALVHMLLDDLRTHCAGQSLELILTLNLSDEAAPDLSQFPFPVQLVRNSTPMGFGANHNQANALARGAYFCVLNPDIRLAMNPFPALVQALAMPEVGVVAPQVLGVDGAPEDSARPFPTPLALVKRLLTGRHVAVYAVQGKPSKPDWVGGMCMLMRQDVYRQTKGFDERYFLYYEDVELCGRLKLLGWNAMLCPDARVTHAAQRSSHKSLKYLRWHLASMLRFFCSGTFVALWRKGYL